MAGINKPPIMNILVVGFHHKFGCQVEFSYPPLVLGTAGKNECPSGWKYLPTLALPDGSHNFTDDTVFFNLPSLVEPTESIYGVSCYRQIPVEKLKIRTADVTRSTVQKSVCILSHLPIYGYIEVKLSLIADAFFEQGDFSCTGLLVKAFDQLNACLFESQRTLQHIHVGLSLRDIVTHWRHKTLILLKLFLLQRRVICYGSPVRRMCVLILGISSLIPRLLEKGWLEVACVRTSRPLSPMPDFTDCMQWDPVAAVEQNPMESISFAGNQNLSSTGDCDEASRGNISASSVACTTEDSNSAKVLTQDQNNQDAELFKRSDLLTREESVETFTSNFNALCFVNPDEYRAPLSVFASGHLCLPYLSLPYMDLLTDPSVLSYVIGTSNVLFQQKRQLADALVDIENANVEIVDQELRRQLTLSTEDLRFMDFMLKHILAPKEDAEGSEQWIRAQFQGYILALLRTTVAEDTTLKDADHFNSNFIHAFKRTQCFQEWHDVRPEPEFFHALPAGHPFAGTLSVTDMKLKIAQTMQNSESGRKINQAVNTTSRAVGGAIGALSNWWSSITTVPTQAVIFSDDADDVRTSSKIAPKRQIKSTPFETNVLLPSLKENAEKSIDSAEEIKEEDSNIDKDLLLSEAEDESVKLQLPQGIIEIGREAEAVLYQDTTKLSRVCPKYSTDGTPPADCINSGVFIV